jgi:hypothetical protein
MLINFFLFLLVISLLHLYAESIKISMIGYRDKKKEDVKLFNRCFQEVFMKGIINDTKGIEN